MLFCLATTFKMLLLKIDVHTEKDHFARNLDVFLQGKWTDLLRYRVSHIKNFFPRKHFFLEKDVAESVEARKVSRSFLRLRGEVRIDVGHQSFKTQSQRRLASRGRWLLKRRFKSHEDSPAFPFSAEEKRGQEESNQKEGD